MSVGEVAARLGVAPSTVRMWGQRYGLTASARTEGGHRRYTVEDLDRLLRMQEAVVSGTSPAVAAAAVMSPTSEIHRPPPRRGGPGGAVLAVPGAGREVRGLARAATRLDEMRVTEAILESLQRRGTLATWDEYVRPVLVAVGEHWQRTGSGIEVEHLLTQAVTAALLRYTMTLPNLLQEAPVVLAGAPHEDHVLALHAARAGLAERGVPVRFLGPRTPMPALASTARLTRAPAALIWMSVKDSDVAPLLASVRAAHRRLTLLVGGAGWDGLDTSSATVCGSLAEAIALLSQAWRDRAGTPAR